MNERGGGELSWEKQMVARGAREMRRAGVSGSRSVKQHHALKKQVLWQTVRIAELRMVGSIQTRIQWYATVDYCRRWVGDWRVVTTEAISW